MKPQPILFFVIIITLLSCTHHIHPVPTLPLTPAVEHFPFMIGVYQNKAFEQYTAKQIVNPDRPGIPGHPGNPDHPGFFQVNYNFEIGKPSSRLFEEVLRNMFEHVVPIDNMNNLPKGIVAILEPSIDGFFWHTKIYPPSIEIIYLVKLYDSERHRIGTLKVTGKGKSDCVFCGPVIETELAMKDAMAQFMIALQEHPEFKHCLANKGRISNKDERSK